MDFHSHARTTGAALKNWFIAQLQDSLAVGLMWLIGLWIIGVPLAPLWALIGALTQFIPNFGAVIALIGPALTAAITSLADDKWMTFLYVLILYAIIAVVDGLILQPYLMKRVAKVPIWASIFAPIVLGFVIPFWGVLLAPPLLAIIYTYRRKREAERIASQPQILPPLRR